MSGEPKPRTATIHRRTNETDVRLTLGLDVAAPADADARAATVRTPIGFLTHMIEALAVHGNLGIDLEASGDTHIDDHHTVEDVGIALGQALYEALGELRGIERFAHAYAPLDGALARVVLDLSGRPHLSYAVELAPSVGSGGFDFALMRDWFQGFVNHARCTLHVDLLRADHSNHHAIEACVKAFALALRRAVARRGDAVPSTKGTL